MHLSSRRILPALVLSLAVGWGVTGCATDENGDSAGSAIIGNWNATTFVVGGVDAIAAGMGLIFTFDNAGDYTFNITNDQVGLCEGNVGDNCSDAGAFDASGTQIVLDPEDEEPTVLNYSVSGETMTITATIDGQGLTATFDRITS